jgi:AraC-like DNA-binding protein
VDPLSDVISLLKPDRYTCSGFDVGGDHSVRFPRFEGIKYYALISGQLWLLVEGMADALRLDEGDCVLLTGGQPCCLTSDPSLPATDVSAFKPMIRHNGDIVTLNGGGDSFTLGGHFLLSGLHAHVLLDLLPSVIPIRKESVDPAFQWSLELLMRELRASQPGSTLAEQHLASLILIQALRVYLSEQSEGTVGWLFALSDEKISRALIAVHGDPAHRWTLQNLAAISGMSRSLFAQKFKAAVGSSAMDYVTQWRMFKATERLMIFHEPIAEIAPSLGYESESAFSAAFKRVMGCSPREYVRTHQRLSFPSGNTRTHGLS